MRALAATANSAGTRHRRGKPQITPYTQRATEVRLAHGGLRRRARRSARGPGRWRRGRRTWREVSRSVPSQREPDRGLAEGDAVVLGLRRHPTKHLRERESRAERARVAGRRSAVRARGVARAVRPERPPVRRRDLRLHRIPVGPRRLVLPASGRAARGRARLRDGWIWRRRLAPPKKVRRRGLSRFSAPARRAEVVVLVVVVVVARRSAGPPSSRLAPRSRRNSRKARADGSSAAAMTSRSSRAWRRRISPGASPTGSHAAARRAPPAARGAPRAGGWPPRSSCARARSGCGSAAARTGTRTSARARREGQQHILEATECALAVDRNQQSLAERLLRDGRDEPLHPPVLLPGRGRVDPQVALGMAATLARREAASGSPSTIASRSPFSEVEKALLIGRVSLECDLQIAPIEGESASACHFPRAPPPQKKHGDQKLMK